jgi:hypothetical protein
MEYSPVGCEGIDDRLIGYMRKKGMRSAAVAMLPPGADDGGVCRSSGDHSREVLICAPQKRRAE